jgi:metallo-beta-lactamase family protein
MEAALNFLGAARNVTGSRYLLEYDGKRIMIDCGLYQERDLRSRNWDTFQVPPGSIDAILLTHAHLDHCGMLPRLVKKGFKGKVHATGATLEIARIALMDSAHLLMEDAEFKKRRHELEDRRGPYPEEPLYTTKDALDCFPLLEGVEYDKPLALGYGLEAVFHDAGHILGSSMVELRATREGEKRKIIFSGDIGRWDKPILKDPTVFEEADYVVMESTYGDRLHEDRKDIDTALEDVIQSTRKRGGNVVIPSFAIERAQEVLYRLNTLLLDDRIPHMMVFIDSPMAVRVTEVFKRHHELYDQEMRELVSEGHSPFRFPSLKMVGSVHESKSINHIKGTVVIIAGSGMCTGGRIKHHLVNNITRPQSTILFVGYQAVGTLGREIVDGAQEVRILGKTYPVKARITQIHGFSAHADRGELLRWASGIKEAPRHVFITHGEPEASESFSEYLGGRTGWPVSVPHYEDRAELE